MATLPITPGQRFGAWVVIGSAQPGANWAARWACKCDCGSQKDVFAANLRRGLSTSCGCLSAAKTSARSRTHGMTGTPTYRTWESMLNRCNNPRNSSHVNYGGRGIKVCDRWASFENFLSDMGEKPEKGMSIERLDVNGNYEPGNCIWADPKTQARNTRRTRLSAELVGALRRGDVTVDEAVSSTGCSRATAMHAKNGRNWEDVDARAS